MTEEQQTNQFIKFDEYFEKQKEKTRKYDIGLFGKYVKGESNIIDEAQSHTTERRCVDYDVCHSEMNSLHSQFNKTSRFAYSHDNYSYTRYLQPPLITCKNSADNVTTKFVVPSINKNKNPIYCIRWTPDGRRLVTGSSKGEFTLWNGLQFTFMSIIAPNTNPIRCMEWTHSGSHLVSGDEKDSFEQPCKIVYYNQTITPADTIYNAHHEKIREISFCPTDNKFVSVGDDKLVKVWDFITKTSEKVYTESENWVYSCDWHPTQNIFLTCSKGKVRLWDSRKQESCYCFSPHGIEINKVRWNKNGNWFLTCSKDQKVKLHDIRILKQPLMVYERHKKDVTICNWHSIQEDLFVSGSANGRVCFWNTQQSNPIAEIPIAHDGAIWDLQWHPVGHLLASCSHDQTTKFWSRDRCGDSLEIKKYQGTNREYDPIVSLYDDDCEQNYYPNYLKDNCLIPNEINSEKICGFTNV